MSYWEEKVKELGTVKAGFRYLVEFEALDNIPEIADIKASCGCTKPSYDAVAKRLSVIFKPKPLSMELQQRGETSYNSNKSLHIFYKNGAVTEILTIKAKVIK